MSFPGYNGAENADDTLVQPWYIRGWTAQAILQDTVQVSGQTALVSPPLLPSNLVYADVTAVYIDADGNPMSGFLTFLMSEGITVTSGGTTYRLPQRYVGFDNSQFAGAINASGNGRVQIRRGIMSATLMTTANPAIGTDSGNPLVYHVTEHMLGGQQYDIILPDTETSPVDLHSLIVAGTVQPYSFDPAFPLGTEISLPAVVPVQQQTMVVDNGIDDIDGGSALTGTYPVNDIDGGSALTGVSSEDYDGGSA